MLANTRLNPSKIRRTPMFILLAEDNRDLAASVLDYLEMKGFECDYAERGDHALQLIQENTYDAVILDVMMPGIDGLNLCKKIRVQGLSTPIIMLTARDTLDDKLAGFKAGADDYLVKPFDLPELEMRLHVIGKRKSNNSITIKIGDLAINQDTHQAHRAGVLLDLSPACWKLLLALAKASPKVLSRSELEKTLWQDTPPDSEALKTHLYMLRKTLDKPFDTMLVHTLRGVGVALRHETH